MKPPAAQASPATPAAAAPAADLAAALCEFDAVLADFASPRHERRFHYGEHLERMKRRSSAGASDSSGFSDSESADSLCRNSLSFSDEKLNSPTDSSPTRLSPTAPPRKARQECFGQQVARCAPRLLKTWRNVQTPALGVADPRTPTARQCSLENNSSGRPRG